MPPPPIQAAVYRRVSTDKQGDSLDDQAKRVAKYAEYKEFHIPEHAIFEDSAVSGRLPLSERPGGSALLRLISIPESGIRHLIVTRLDRLGRNAIDIQTNVNFFGDAPPKGLGLGIHILAAGGVIDTTTSFGKFFIGILSLFAELEVSTITERITDVLATKFAQHHLIGTVPFGYDTEPTGHTHPKSGKALHRLIPNPAEQHWLRQMIAWRASGLSYQHIAARLNAQGARTKAGLQNKWQQGNVHKTLHSKHTARFQEESRRAEAVSAGGADDSLAPIPSLAAA